MLREDYVSFEQAKRLKELGFPQITEGKWFSTYLSLYPVIQNYELKYPEIYAPTLSLVQKWLREEKNLQLAIRFRGNCWFYDLMSGYKCLQISDDVDTYEKALSNGINKALELIENEK